MIISAAFSLLICHSRRTRRSITAYSGGDAAGFAAGVAGRVA